MFSKALSIFLALLVLYGATGCSNVDKTKAPLHLSSRAENLYHFSLLRTGLDSSYSSDILEDTFRLEGTLQTVKEEDSATYFRFIFSSFQMLSSAKPTIVTIDRQGRKRTMNNGFIEERDSIFSLLTGMDIFILINRKGEVLQVEGLDKLMGGINETSNLTPSTIRLNFQQHLTETAFKDIFNRVFYLFPDKPVKPGDQWGNDITLVAKAPVLFSNMYKLEGQTNDRAIIRITSLISARAGEGGKTYMKGNQSGIAEVSSTKGLPIHVETLSFYITTIDHYDSTGKEKLKQRRQEKLVVNIKPQAKS